MKVYKILLEEIDNLQIFLAKYKHPLFFINLL